MALQFYYLAILYTGGYSNPYIFAIDIERLLVGGISFP
jgi:hypothetical protein